MIKFKSRKFLLFLVAFVIGTVALFFEKINGWVWIAIPGTYGIINTAQKRMFRGVDNSEGCDDK